MVVGFFFNQWDTAILFIFGHAVQHTAQFPKQGWILGPLQWKHRILTSGPPRKAQDMQSVLRKYALLLQGPQPRTLPHSAGDHGAPDHKGWNWEAHGGLALKAGVEKRMRKRHRQRHPQQEKRGFSLGLRWKLEGGGTPLPHTC